MIDWTRSAQDIHNHIRGLNPFPTAWTTLNGKSIKVHTSKCSETNDNLRPGEVKIIEKKLLVGTESTSIQLIGLQMEGKKRATALDFMNAYKEELENSSFGS